MNRLCVKNLKNIKSRNEKTGGFFSNEQRRVPRLLLVGFYGNIPEKMKRVLETNKLSAVALYKKNVFHILQ
jgi:hypothetical protein